MKNFRYDVTSSGIPIKAWYESQDAPETFFENPGEFPFVRGSYPLMYRGQEWCKRMLSGIGGPELSNERFKYLIKLGETGLCPTADLPTYDGMDPDDELVAGFVGVGGFSAMNLPDIRRMFQEIPMEDFSITLVESGIGSVILFAGLLATAQERDTDMQRFRGGVITDVLLNHMAGWGKTTPIEIGMKLTVDMIEWCITNAPQARPLSIAGYDIGELGANAYQQVAFMLSEAKAYLDACQERGLDVDKVAPMLAFSFNIGMDFFEEIAKIRALRKMWAEMIRYEYDAQNPKSWRLKASAKTSGRSLTRQVPMNNIVRIAYETLACVLGGVQAVDPCGYDEAFIIPSRQAAALAANTQHIISYETGVTKTADPLGGSYYMEALTQEIQLRAREILTEIEHRGGMVEAVKSGWCNAIMDAEIERQQGELVSGERIVVGVNAFQMDDEDADETQFLRSGEELWDADARRRRVEEVRVWKATRDPAKVQLAITELNARILEGRERPEINVFPAIIDALRADLTLGEIAATIRGAYNFAPEVYDVLLPYGRG